MAEMTGADGHVAGARLASASEKTFGFDLVFNKFRPTFYLKRLDADPLDRQISVYHLRKFLEIQSELQTSAAEKNSN